VKLLNKLHVINLDRTSTEFISITVYGISGRRAF